MKPEPGIAHPAIDRRTFLLAGACGAGALVQQEGHAQAQPTRRRIRVGFLGVAYSHAAEKLRLIQASPDFELVGAWAESRELEQSCRERGIPVLQRPEVLARSELIFVESEVARHAPLALEALQAGCHVHLEKPPALHLHELDGLLRIARERGRLLQVGYMWRHHPGLQRAFQLVREGALGQLFLLRIAIDNQLDPARRKEWAAFPGGVLFELGSHMIDATVRLLGRPDRVTPFLRTLGGMGADPDTLADTNVAVLEYPRTTVVITSTALRHNASGNRSFEFCGTAGNARLQPIEPPELSIELQSAAGSLPAGRSSIPIAPYRRYVGELDELAHCIRDQRPLAVSPDTERIVQETLLRACGTA